MFVGVYSAYDAGTSYPTSTTITVVVVSIGFILGGIYLLISYLKNRKILKQLDWNIVYMTDFKKIAADGFEINAKILDNNPEDAWDLYFSRKRFWLFKNAPGCKFILIWQAF